MIFLALLFFFPAFLISKDNNSEFSFSIGYLSEGKFAKEISGIMYGYAKTDDSMLLYFNFEENLKKNFFIGFEFLDTFHLSNEIDGANSNSTYLLFNLRAQAKKNVITPYIGIGAGFNKLKESSSPLCKDNCLDLNIFGFSWDYFGGIKIYFTKKFSLKFDYKYLYTKINKRDLQINEYHWYFFKDHLKVKSLLMGFSFLF